jgi:hypothetical protein
MFLTHLAVEGPGGWVARPSSATSASFESAISRLYGGKSKPCSRSGQGHSASQERMACNPDETPSLN